MTAFLDPLTLPEPAAEEEEDDAPDEGVVVDGLGISRLGFRCWTERHSDPVSGDFFMFHRAAVWDASAGHVESRPAASREAALNEALGRYLAIAGATPQQPPALAESDVQGG